jgi:hypothetical protein
MNRLQRLKVVLHEMNTDDWLAIVRAACNLRKLELHGNECQIEQPADYFHLDVVAQSCPLLRCLALYNFDCSTASDAQVVHFGNLHSLELHYPRNIQEYRLATPNLRRLRLLAKDSSQYAPGFLAFWQRVLENSSLTHVDLDITLDDDAFLHWLPTLSRFRFLQVLTFRSTKQLLRPRFGSPTVSRFVEAVQASRLSRYLSIRLLFTKKPAVAVISEAMPNIKVVQA